MGPTLRIEPIRAGEELARLAEPSMGQLMHEGCLRQSYQFFAAFMVCSRLFRSRAFKVRDSEVLMRGFGMEFANSLNYLEVTS